MTHFHVWTRSGKIFTMQERRFDSRTDCEQRPSGCGPPRADRLVLRCASCPSTRPSKRRPPRWALVARNLAARFSIDANALRTALVSELAAERERRLACGPSLNPGRCLSRSGIAAAPGQCHWRDAAVAARQGTVWG